MSVKIDKNTVATYNVAGMYFDIALPAGISDNSMLNDGDVSWTKWAAIGKSGYDNLDQKVSFFEQNGYEIRLDNEQIVILERVNERGE